jgi:ribose transport system permease protein
MTTTEIKPVSESASRLSAPHSEETLARQSRVFEIFERFGLIGLIVIAIIVFSITAPQTFPTFANAQNIASSQAILAVLGLAIMFPLIVGRFDVSAGSVLGASAVLSAWLMTDLGWGTVPSMLASLALGSVIGTVNGVIVAYLGVNSIIATIGVATIIAGILQAFTSGVAITGGIDQLLTGLSTAKVFEIPALFLIAMVICAIGWFVITQTPWGRRLTAIGSNASSARLVGIPVRRTVVSAFATGGLLAGLGGVMQVAIQGSGDPGIGGLAYILPALAAVFLGATTWRPGTYNVPGMIIALFFIGIAVTGLVLTGVAPWVTDVFNGLAVVVALIISAQLRRRRTGQAELGA